MEVLKDTLRDRRFLPPAWSNAVSFSGRSLEHVGPRGGNAPCGGRFAAARLGGHVPRVERARSAVIGTLPPRGSTCSRERSLKDTALDHAGGRKRRPRNVSFSTSTVSDQDVPYMHFRIKRSGLRITTTSSGIACSPGPGTVKRA